MNIHFLVHQRMCAGKDLPIRTKRCRAMLANSYLTVLSWKPLPIFKNKSTYLAVRLLLFFYAQSKTFKIIYYAYLPCRKYICKCFGSSNARPQVWQRLAAIVRHSQPLPQQLSCLAPALVRFWQPQRRHCAAPVGFGILEVHLAPACHGATWRNTSTMVKGHQKTERYERFKFRGYMVIACSVSNFKSWVEQKAEFPVSSFQFHDPSQILWRLESLLTVLQGQLSLIQQQPHVRPIRANLRDGHFQWLKVLAKMATVPFQREPAMGWQRFETSHDHPRAQHSTTDFSQYKQVYQCKRGPPPLSLCNHFEHLWTNWIAIPVVHTSAGSGGQPQEAWTCAAVSAFLSYSQGPNRKSALEGLPQKRTPSTPPVRTMFFPLSLGSLGSQSLKIISIPAYPLPNPALPSSERPRNSSIAFQPMERPSL